MKTQLLVVLTVTNAALLIFLLAQPQRTAAQDVAPVLRARAFEILDDHGRVRAEIKVFPRDPAVKMPDGTTGYPETVLLRLIDSKGSPHVKIGASEDGSSISLGGDSNPTDIQLLARGRNTSLTLINKDGKQQLIKPKD
ncbi:MAG: hypothetical protein ACR2JB_19135 [Bryobacteraceae bacterium]